MSHADEKEIEPRRLVHRGSVVARGLAFERREGDAGERARLLSFWEAHARLLAFEDHWVLLWRRPRRVSTAELRAMVLVEYGATLSAAPLTPREAARFTSRASSCSFVRAGRLITLPLTSARELDPSSWLAPFEVVVARALAGAPPPPAQALPERASSPRDALGNTVGSSPAEREQVLRALTRGARGASSEPRATAGAALTWLVGLLATAIEIFRKIGARFSRGAPDPAANTLPQPNTTPHGKSAWQRLRDGFAAWVWRGRLGSWLGQKHAAYLGRMMEMFDRGDYEEALRYAIPTSKGLGGASSPPSLLPSAPRQSLALGGARGTGGSLGLDGELFQHLRALYRRAFDELERRGQILQAAFVLSELLEDDQAAVHFLERKGRLVEAAELAEVRKLPSALVVRQWFLAGDRQRALLVARRDGAFEDAIARLQDVPEQQRALRLLWADHLADCGRYAEAVLVLQGERDTAPLRLAWLDLAIEAGGVSGAQALALKITRFPEELESARARALELLGDDSSAAPSARLAFARALLPAEGAGARALLRGATRALLRDRAQGKNREPRGFFLNLARKSDDGALHADLPAFAGDDGARASPPEPYSLQVGQNDRGPSKLEDALYLPDGRILVAQGELGCFLYSRRFERVHHFDVPAYRLVPSFHGGRVLALAPRDDTTVVSRIALEPRRCERWIEAPLSAFAPSFDGSVWFVAWDRQVYALDALSSSLSSIWSSGRADGDIVRIAVDREHLSFLTSDECWVHDRAPLRLKARAGFEGVPALAPGGLAGAVEERPSEAGALWVFHEEGQAQLPLASPEAAVLRPPQVFGPWLVFVLYVPIEVPELMDVHVIERSSRRTAAHLRLPGSRAVRARIEADVLTVCDEHGRLVIVDLTTGRTIHDRRL